MSHRIRRVPPTPGFVLALTVPLVCLHVLAPAAHATAPLPGAEEQGPGGIGPRGGVVEWPEGRINYLFELDQLAAFQGTWQELTPGPDFGGMIEAEAGPLGEVIQTDNTLEAIWVWSRYTEITGRTTYLQNIADAWTYCQNFPPWLEEGPVSGYYRAHNCAWALTAESAYRSATGDTTFLAYAATSADWIAAHPLFINQTQTLNAFVQGWTSGNLYLYAEELGHAGWMSSALTLGGVVKSYIDANPATNLARETWAMSAGTMVWGLCNSVFRDDPVTGADWIGDHGAQVDTFQVWYNVPLDGYDWDNSWNVAYANAHFAMADVTGDPQWERHGENLTRKLLSYDEDDDGGIQATTQDPVTEDMSWVSCYLTKFGVVRLLGTPADNDAGTLAFLSPQDGSEIGWPVGAPIPITVRVSNFGLLDLEDVSVELEGDVTGSVVLDLPFASREDVVVQAGWTPPAPGDYTFTVHTAIAGDTVPANDSLSITVHVFDTAGLSESTAGSFAAPRAFPSPFGTSTRIHLRALDGRVATLGIYSPEGRIVREWEIPAGAAREVSFPWDGSDRSARPLPAGVYFLRADAAGRSATGRVVLVR